MLGAECSRLDSVPDLGSHSAFFFCFPRQRESANVLTRRDLVFAWPRRLGIAPSLRIQIAFPLRPREFGTAEALAQWDLGVARPRRLGLAPSLRIQFPLPPRRIFLSPLSFPPVSPI